MSNAPARVSIIGLPESGKTTLLAATWHMIREDGSVTALKFDGLSQGNYEHLNGLAKLWRAGKIQKRTESGALKTVVMCLKDANENSVEVTFPDVPGEEFTRMWEDRVIDDDTAATLDADAIVLLVNGDSIRLPMWVVDEMEVAKKAKLVLQPSTVVEWKAEFAPTQVQVVELLQMLMSRELGIGPRRLAVLISAWDKAAGEQLTPVELLAAKLPLLDQYLRNGRDPWTWQVWGLSAQGGVYEDPEKDELNDDTEALRELERPSDRIKVVDGSDVTTDITAPLAWLIQ